MSNLDAHVTPNAASPQPLFFKYPGGVQRTGAGPLCRRKAASIGFTQ